VKFLDLGRQPYANALLSRSDQAEAVYPLSLSWCPACGLVQLNETASPDELFSGYVWVTGTSSTARQYADLFCEQVLRRFGGRPARYVLEAASNDGTFLRPFMRQGCRVLGVDPAANIVDRARADGIPTECSFFGRVAAERVVAEHGPADVVVARNVLPHVADVHDFVDGIARCMGDKTLLAVEVHYAGVILEQLHYDSIYHEHLCYFTLTSLEALLRRHGLETFDVMTSPISGGSIVLFAGKMRQAPSPFLRQLRQQEAAADVNALSRWVEFAQRVDDHRICLGELLHEEKTAGRLVAGYGASARSSTLLNFCGIDSRTVRMIADRNPLKHNRFTAGTRIPIDSPESVMKAGPDTVLLLAWNFEKEIVETLQNEFGFAGRVIVPLPNEPRVYSTGVCHAAG
jgi:hypothetical protein